MNHLSLFRRIFCITVALILLMLLASCTGPENETAYPQTESLPESKNKFTQREDRTVVSPSGVEYVPLANEGVLYILGEIEYNAEVAGEEEYPRFQVLPYKAGIYSIKGASDDILVRYYYDNEWYAIYRKASLPKLDYSFENCIRLELVQETDSIHATCGDGITDSEEISAFFTEIRSQQTSREAGLYDLIRMPDGSLNNCYCNCMVLGYFAEDPNVAVRMDVWSFNDLAYAIDIGDTQYVLPDAWLQKLQIG